MAAMARLNRILQSNTINFASKFKLCEFLVTSILLYGCGTWTLLAYCEKRIQAFKIECLRKPLYISSSERKANDWMRGKVSFLVGPQEPQTSDGNCQEMKTYVYTCVQILEHRVR